MNEHVLTEVQPPPGDLFVVGIGASAGGLEALKAFLSEIPPEPGCAFVLAQHVGDAERFLPSEGVAQLTSLPVVAPDRFQNAPPNEIVTIKDGCFRLRRTRTPSSKPWNWSCFVRENLERTVQDLEAAQRGA